MSAILTHDCPYCGTRDVAMNYRGRTGKLTRKADFRSSINTYCDWFLLSCGSCKRGVLAGFAFRGDAHSHKVALENASSQNFEGTYFELDFQLKTLFPDRGAGNAPEGTPLRIVGLFDQATSNLANRNWDASGAMSRKCLDVATKVLARKKILEENDLQSALKAVLKNRIELLHSHSLITDEIAELAMVIKDEGNDASHDEEEYTQEGATALVEFTKVFLTYVFTIPQMVASVKPVEQEADSS